MTQQKAQGGCHDDEKCCVFFGEKKAEKNWSGKFLTKKLMKALIIRIQATKSAKLELFTIATMYMVA